jgi:hypothetical protein
VSPEGRRRDRSGERGRRSGEESALLDEYNHAKDWKRKRASPESKRSKARSESSPRRRSLSMSPKRRPGDKTENKGISTPSKIFKERKVVSTTPEKKDKSTFNLKTTSEKQVHHVSNRLPEKTRARSRSESTSGSEEASDEDEDDEDEDEDEQNEKELEKERMAMKHKLEEERAKKEAEKESEMREELLRRIHKKAADESGQNVSDASSDQQTPSQNPSDQTLLEKVNEIIKSCVKLKEDKGISEEKLNKANKIIEKAQEKKKSLTEQLGEVEEKIHEEKERLNERIQTRGGWVGKSDQKRGMVEVTEKMDASNQPDAEADNEDDGRRTPLAYRTDRARSESASEFELEVSLDAKIKEHLEEDGEMKIVVKPLPPVKPKENYLEEGELKETSKAGGKENNDKAAVDGSEPVQKALEEELKKLSSEVEDRSRSRERSVGVTEELQAMSGRSDKRAVAASRGRRRSSSSSQSRPRRSRSWSRSRSRSRSRRSRSWTRSRSRTRSRERDYGRDWEDRRGWGKRRDDWGRREGGDRGYRPYQYRDQHQHQDRQGQHWIPVTPCAIQEDIDLGPGETGAVSIRAKGEFSFKDNSGCMVRITKWTGKDAMSSVQIRPQIVELDNKSTLKVEVTNPHEERGLELMKYDKIACLSILSAPTHPGLFRSLDCSPDRYETDARRWFKVTTVVLHKKGSPRACPLLLTLIPVLEGIGIHTVFQSGLKLCRYLS